MSIADVKEHVDRAVETDYIMPLYMPFLPILLVTSGVIVIISTYISSHTFEFYYYGYVLYSTPPPIFPIASLILGTILVLLGGVVNIYVVYKWVKRRNDHFVRAIALFDRAKEYLAKGWRAKAEAELSRMDKLIKDYQLEFEHRNPVLWALLQLVPYVGSILLLYVYHFLNRDFWRHYLWERRVLEALNEALARIGVEPTVRFRDDYVFPSRNTVLYVVLTLVTLGVFAFYWVYTLAKDPNEHFLEHRRLEGKLLEALSRLPPT